MGRPQTKCLVCHGNLNDNSEKSLTSTGIYHTQCWRDHPEIVRARRIKAGIIPSSDNCSETVSP